MPAAAARSRRGSRPAPPPAASRVGARRRRPASARPRDRRSSTRRRSRRSPGSPCVSPRWYSTTFVSPGRGTTAARRSRTGRASRRGRRASWPTSRRTSATTSWDVGPGGLQGDEDPVHGPRQRPRADDEPLGLGEDRAARLANRRRDRRAGGAGVTAASERARQNGRVDAAGLRADADSRRLRPPP